MLKKKNKSYKDFITQDWLSWKQAGWTDLKLAYKYYKIGWRNPSVALKFKTLADEDIEAAMDWIYYK